MQPLVSVIIPTYNKVDSLNRCLDSLLRQDLSPELFEIIVVFDGGSHNAAIKPRVKYLWLDSNQGPGAARNLAIHQCRAPIIALVDDDFIVRRDFISKIIRAFQQNQQLKTIRFKINNYSRDLLSQANQFYFQSSDARIEKENGIFPVGGGNALSKEVFDRVGVFDESLRYAEDLELAWRIIRSGMHIAYFPAISIDNSHPHTLAASLNQKFNYGRGFYQVRQKFPDYPVKGPDDAFWTLRYLSQIITDPFWRIFSQKDLSRSLIYLPLLFLFNCARIAGVFWQKYLGEKR